MTTTMPGITDVTVRPAAVGLPKDQAAVRPATAVKRRKKRRWVITTVAIVFSIIWIFPVYWMVNTSFKPISDVMSATLHKRGFRFAGTAICYALMQAMGMVDGHEPGCRHRATAG